MEKKIKKKNMLPFLLCPRKGDGWGRSSRVVFETFLGALTVSHVRNETVPTRVPFLRKNNCLCVTGKYEPPVRGAENG